MHSCMHAYMHTYVQTDMDTHIERVSARIYLHMNRETERECVCVGVRLSICLCICLLYLCPNLCPCFLVYIYMISKQSSVRLVYVSSLIAMRSLAAPLGQAKAWNLQACEGHHSATRQTDSIKPAEPSSAAETGLKEEKSESESGQILHW